MDNHNIMNQELSNKVAIRAAQELSRHKDQYSHIEEISVSHNEINYKIKTVGETHEIRIGEIVDNTDVFTLWCSVDINTKDVV